VASRSSSHAAGRRWTRRGTTIRFVNTHLEAFHAYFNGAQAQELATLLGSEVKAVVLVGELSDRVWSSVAAALIWPSDHIGVVATLQYRIPRPVGPPPKPGR
jgi:hypothetical protein